jgi:opacity protein-like surface antigen
MHSPVKAGLASAFVVAMTAIFLPAHAADLGPRWSGGSIKDAPMPVREMGRCYFRADVGYSLSADPDGRWPVTDFATGNLITDKVRTIDIEDTWLVEGGFGCGLGYGFRGELMFGYHGKKKFDGEPGPWFPFVPPRTDDPLHTSVTSYTLMANIYKDLGTIGGWTPYVGAGIGLAFNEMDEVYFTENAALQNRIKGDDETSFAWALMAGVGYQISDRAILDFGYRYIDLGRVSSGRIDSAGFVNPRVTIDDLAAHEFKVGLRYHFGG